MPNEEQLKQGVAKLRAKRANLQQQRERRKKAKPPKQQEIGVATVVGGTAKLHVRVPRVTDPERVPYYKTEKGKAAAKAYREARKKEEEEFKQWKERQHSSASS